ncbi:MAG: methylenetetrahydrofolate reductase [NAD(P)H] [Treponemataceae bacterium]|nr:methylenetetrahydrofolate reductase [NAD(P)H] [Treponemataceae bacterium]
MENKNHTIFSFEVFPPKKAMGINTIYETLDQLRDLRPDFISVTYGAGGSENCENTLNIAQRITDACGVTSVVHLPCLNMSRTDAASVLEQFQSAGIENILALRGDKVAGREPCGDFHHASELAEFIREFDSRRTDGRQFKIFGACYPERHPESATVFDDIHALKLKADAGVSHLLSQLFFDNEKFYRFLERARLGGISIPIEAGIMPATNKNSIERMVSITNATLPPKFIKMMERYGDSPESIRDAGIAYAVDQIVDLVTNGVEGIHLYTMNNPYVARRINDAVRSLFAAPPLAQEII